MPPAAFVNGTLTELVPLPPSLAKVPLLTIEHAAPPLKAMPPSLSNAIVPLFVSVAPFCM